MLSAGGGHAQLQCVRLRPRACGPILHFHHKKKEGKSGSVLEGNVLT